MDRYEVVEICAGAGGQALGLERAGFEHALAVEIDTNACSTLRANRPEWKVEQGDVADRSVWRPEDYRGVTLFAGGVPCPPFSIAGKQLGTSDERDLFAWAVEQVGTIQPEAILLENVRGLSMPRFAAYRQHVLDRLAEWGYVGFWKLLHASDFGVAQLRPRFVLVSLKQEHAPFYHWPEQVDGVTTVGEAVGDLMGELGWPYVDEWIAMARHVAPTIVGGSKKHGGADLGPTRAKRAWLQLGVDAMGLADRAPGPDDPAPSVKPPRLTVEMVARIQGWNDSKEWQFEGRKTSKYRQVGNAFPPPLAEAVGRSIMSALRHDGAPKDMPELTESIAHDEVYRLLRASDRHLTQGAIVRKLGGAYSEEQLERRIAHLKKDFVMDVRQTSSGLAYRLGEFKGFIGQEDHDRHTAFTGVGRSQIS